MSVLCAVEMVPAHLTPDEWEKGHTFSRVPCVGELLFTEDQTFRVVGIFHPMLPEDRPRVRVVQS